MDEIPLHSPMKDLIDNLVKLQALQPDKTTNAGSDDRIVKLRATIPEPILAHYDRLTARGKKGVAGVRNQVCTGCHMQVPLGVTFTLMHGDDLQICESCGRYLYLLESAPAEPIEPKKAAKREKKSGAGKPKPELLAA